MANYITIDGGTSTTRLQLVLDGVVADSLRHGVGVKVGLSGREAYRQMLARSITELLERNRLESAAIARILASGMITSEFGLLDLPHILTPAGIGELHASMYETVLPDISEIPFVFIRGVKMNAGELAQIDVMRGEETELMGLWQGGTGICCLPGSHMKTIRVGEDGRITAFRTSLTGEMIFALSQDTILKHAVELDAPMDPAYLLMGYDHCERLGLSQTLFKVRLLDTQLHASRAGIYSFFLGAVLWEDVSRLIADAPAKVVIGGKRQLREAMALLLQSRSRIEVIGVTEALVAASTALGAVRIYEYGKNQREESPKNK